MSRALVRYEDVRILEVSELVYDSMKAKINSLEDTQFPVSSSVLYIPIRLKTEKQIRDVTLDELFQALRIDAPAQIRDTKEYNLFLYAEPDSAKAECLAAGITDNLCYGPRIGLIMKIPQAETGSDVRQLMQEWEKTMADDLRPLLLALPQKGEETVFKTGKYRDFETRYINLPISTMSFDWILTDGTLIIATSKDAARTALDRILENEAGK
ncbi:MAG: hypothetical protein HYS15_02740 [Candidatus Spechtbacteria bacterium]|nr:hypothetical protein [Candidatus Spechtbacteria bacterium]